MGHPALLKSLVQRLKGSPYSVGVHLAVLGDQPVEGSTGPVTYAGSRIPLQRFGQGSGDRLDAMRRVFAARSMRWWRSGRWSRRATVITRWKITGLNALPMPMAVVVRVL